MQRAYSSSIKLKFHSNYFLLLKATLLCFSKRQKTKKKHKNHINLKFINSQLLHYKCDDNLPLSIVNKSIILRYIFTNSKHINEIINITIKYSLILIININNSILTLN